MQKTKKLTPFLVSMLFISTSIAHATQTVHFTDVHISSEWSFYAGKIHIMGSAAVDNEDEVAAFVQGNDGNEIMVGSCVYGKDAPSGNFFMPVYANDISTPEKDGADINDLLSFKLWDKSQNNEYDIYDKNIQIIDDPDLTKPAYPITFTIDDTFGLLNMHVVKEVIKDGSLDLKDVIALMKRLAKISPDSNQTNNQTRTKKR